MIRSYQRRAVGWMLKREHAPGWASPQPLGSLQQAPSSSGSSVHPLHPLWRCVCTLGPTPRPFFINPDGMVADEVSSVAYLVMMKAFFWFCSICLCFVSVSLNIHCSPLCRMRCFNVYRGLRRCPACCDWDRDSTTSRFTNGPKHERSIADTLCAMSHDAHQDLQCATCLMQAIPVPERNPSTVQGGILSGMLSL